MTEMLKLILERRATKVTDLFLESMNSRVEDLLDAERADFAVQYSGPPEPPELSDEELEEIVDNLSDEELEELLGDEEEVNETSWDKVARYTKKAGDSERDAHQTYRGAHQPRSFGDAGRFIADPKRHADVDKAAHTMRKRHAGNALMMRKLRREFPVKESWERPKWMGQSKDDMRSAASAAVSSGHRITRADPPRKAGSGYAEKAKPTSAPDLLPTHRFKVEREHDNPRMRSRNMMARQSNATGKWHLHRDLGDKGSIGVKIGGAVDHGFPTQHHAQKWAQSMWARGHHFEDVRTRGDMIAELVSKYRS